MTETELLLQKSTQSHNHGNRVNGKQLAVNTLRDWRQCLRGQKMDEDDYEKIEDQDKGTAEGSPVGIFSLFRFADRLDYLLMVSSLCFLVLHAASLIANLIIFGQITGLFAMKSFTVSCNESHQINKTLVQNNDKCPLGIGQNSITSIQLSRLCNNNTNVLSSSQSTQMPEFREKVMNNIYLLFAIAIISCISSALEQFIWSMSIKRQKYQMSIQLFRSLLQRNVAYIDVNNISQFNEKLFNNIDKIEMGIGHGFVSLIGTLLIMIVSTTISFIINWKLALIIFCINPFVIVTSLIFAQLTAKEVINELLTYSKAGQIAQEVFSSLRTVFSLNGGEFEQKRYEKHLQSTRWSNMRKSAIMGIFIGWLSLVNYIVYALGFIFGSILISYDTNHLLNISDILVCITISAQCISFFGVVGPMYQAFSEAQGAAAPVFQLIDEGQDSNINEMDLLGKATTNEKIEMNVIGDIEFDNVTFDYPSRKDLTVLHNLNIMARVNKTTALVGRSGCGKSTCISLLLRFYQPSSGQIKINGQPISDYPIKQFRENIGVVSQEPILFGSSIYENIRFGKLNATRNEIEEAAKEANAHNFIMNLPDKYETLVGDSGVQLSGGEKQRVALARALIKKPSILLLDEATSALDNVSEKIVQEALDRACKNRTTIIIAHRLSTIQNADHIYVFDKGKVVEEGTHESLMMAEGSRYQTMVKRQQTERVMDHKNDLSNMEDAIREDERQMLERSRLLSESDAFDTKRRDSIPSKKESIFLRLIRMNRSDWINILIGCTASIFCSLCQPLFAYFLAKIISSFKDCGYSSRHDAVLSSCFLFFLLGLLLMANRFFQYSSFGIAGSNLTYQIRSKAFACLLRQEVAYFDRPENSPGSLCARLSTDATAVQDLGSTRLGVMCESIALSVFGLVFGLLFSVELTLIVLVFTIVIILVSAVDIRVTKHLKYQEKLINERASALSLEVIQHMRTVKQLSIEDEILQQYSRFMKQILNLSWKPTLGHSSFMGVFWAFDPAVLACLYWCALILIEYHKLQLENIIIIISFATFALQSPKALTAVTERIGFSMAAAETFFALFDRKPNIDNLSTKGQILADFRGDIELDHVKFVYPSRPTISILNKLHLSVKSGQRVALVGSSGCGKSTIIQLLERFYDASGGQVLLDGVDIRQLNLHWVRSRLGLVSQEPILFDLTIAENITYGLENIPMSEIIHAAKKANIHEFIEQLPQGYDTLVGIKGGLLSGGEKQRIAIARVLIRRPRILLLDEATSAMDSHNEQIVQQALEEAQTEDPTRTSIIIAHRLSTIRSCDFIYVIDKGYIVEAGTHAELIQLHGYYYQMLATQNNL
ncbi:unnamed protein product [Adineta ricciae]|uniref:Uncharacterized protein n=1 Tax=Adineta ricciae TaxID=249248 RepID=A0A815TZ06_ADIRI|nr:unnamed protein product [Adineta ricciae]